MAFWEDFSETISVKSKEMADKAKNLTDIANLKGQIVSHENTILRNYREIGRAYYNAHKDDMTKEFPEEMSNIANAERMIAELNKKISDLKGTKKCASCGNEIPNDSSFCSKCGQKVEEETFYDDEDTDIVVADSFSEIIEDDDVTVID